MKSGQPAPDIASKSVLSPIPLVDLCGVWTSILILVRLDFAAQSVVSNLAIPVMDERDLCAKTREKIWKLYLIYSSRCVYNEPAR